MFYFLFNIFVNRKFPLPFRPDEHEDEGRGLCGALIKKI
jgi:hypothetical protein